MNKSLIAKMLLSFTIVIILLNACAPSGFKYIPQGNTPTPPTANDKKKEQTEINHNIP